MSRPISNFVTQFLSWNDRVISDPLMHRQFKPVIGVFPAFAQILTSTVAAVATTVFALLAGLIGGICRLVGARRAGNDLLQSAKIAFFGPNDRIAGAAKLFGVAGFSLVNMVSITGLARCLAAQESFQPSSAF